jgi:sensor histidine kinase YesM
MPPEKLNQLICNGNLPNKEDIGISNVIRRLEIYYGKNTISFESTLRKGTTVKMTLPKEMHLIPETALI